MFLRPSPCSVHICCLVATDIDVTLLFILCGSSIGAGRLCSHTGGCVSRAVFTSSLKLLLLLFPDANKRGIMIIIMVNLFHKVVLKTKSMNIYKVLEIGHYI